MLEYHIIMLSGLKAYTNGRSTQTMMNHIHPIQNYNTVK